MSGVSNEPPVNWNGRRLTGMPGSLFELVCPGCGNVHEMSTGVDYCIDHGAQWHYEQMVCTHCRRLRSWPAGCHFDTHGRCEECGTKLSGWAGCVWFEQSGPEPWQQQERVEGPCPSCARTLRESDSRIQGLWD